MHYVFGNTGPSQMIKQINKERKINIDVDYDSSSPYLRTCSSIEAKDKAMEALDH